MPAPLPIAPVSISPTVTIGGPLPALIMGPCVIESEAHALRMAEAVKAAAAAVGWPVVFKASYDKANRSSHASFRGLGIAEGLRILALARERTGLPVTTDVHDCAQAEQAGAVVDLLQVPAFLCRQSDLIEACAATGKATSVKKGQFLAPWDCANIVAKFRAAGGRDIVLIERGTSFGYNTLVVDYRGLAVMRDLGVPVVFDGTHCVQSPGGLGSRSGGDGHYAPMMMRAALAVGCEGLFLEVHDNPKAAPSDGPNMVPLAELPALLRDLKAIHDAIGRPAPPRPRS